MSSPNQMHWQDLLQLVREENPGLPLRDVMIIASKLRKSRKLPKGSYKVSRSRCCFSKKFFISSTGSDGTRPFFMRPN